MKQTYAPLFQPYTFNNDVTIKNRLVVAPLTIYDSGFNGKLTDTARNFWRNRFQGFGMWIMPFTNVHPNGVGFESPDAFNNANLPTLKEYAKIGHDQGVKVIMQLGHSGFKAKKSMTRGLSVVTPSENGRNHSAHIMTASEVEDMVQRFANAAKLAIEAGIDGVEIQGANGWLIEQFFGANTNQRHDQWGGNFENRISFSIAIIQAINKIKKETNRPDFIVGYRFSPERPRDGFTMSDSLALVDELVKQPLQYLHVSLLGFYSRPRRGANKKLSRMKLYHDRIANKIPLIGVGSLKTADDMIEAYNTGWADFIALGRTVMLNPDLIDLIENEQETKIETIFNWEHRAHYRYTPAMLYAEEHGLDMAYRNPKRLTTQERKHYEQLGKKDN